LRGSSNTGHAQAAGLQAFQTGRFQPIDFLQAPSEVVLINLGDTQVRHVYMNVPHAAAPKPYGDSVGHYEDNELVVDTIGFNDKTFVDETYDLPHTTQLHVIERLINEPLPTRGPSLQRQNAQYGQICVFCRNPGKL
jgi:hypothetical protein